mgnify:CR=1 FL=1
MSDATSRTMIREDLHTNLLVEAGAGANALIPDRLFEDAWIEAETLRQPEIGAKGGCQ